MQNNICKFIPNSSANEENINILNFVYERKKQTFKTIHCEAVYKMHFVTKGCGKININGIIYELEENDVFLTFPSVRYAIESDDDFEYIYISFLGMRANRIMDKLNITKKNFLFKGCDDLSLIWKNSIFDDISVLSWRCEGILLYTFSNIVQLTSEQNQEYTESVLKIKKYIDENFTDTNLSLDKISRIYTYNKKYISSSFKKKMGVGIVQYISELRIQHACSLIERGVTSVKDISFLSGYNEPLYFSKIFKSKIGISPKEYIASAKR